MQCICSSIAWKRMAGNTGLPKRRRCTLQVSWSSIKYLDLNTMNQLFYRKLCNRNTEFRFVLVSVQFQYWPTVALRDITFH